MIKPIQFIFWSELFVLTFDAPVDVAVERLKSKVKNVSLFSFTTQGMVGRVSEKNVKILRIAPIVRNSFKPILVGSFKKEDNKTIFSGVFRFHRFVQIFMTFWFGFIVLLTLLALIAKPSEAWFFPLFGLLMASFGVGLVKIGKWFSRNDKNWLMENITNAINGQKI